MGKKLSMDFNTRQYMQSANFELFYYNDSALRSVAPHSHDYCELYFFLEGNVDYHIGSSTYRLKYGDCLLIPPNTPHYPTFLSHTGPYRRFVFWISREFYQELHQKDACLTYGFDQVSSGSDFCFRGDHLIIQDIHGRLMDLLEEQGTERPFRAQAAELMAISLLVRVNRLVYETQHPLSPVSENALYLNICNYINQNLEGDLSLDRLAASFYMSKYHISHMFKNNMGIPLHQYILKKRLHASRQSILSDQPISHVYQQYGFKDYTSFFRAFKKEFGVSPREYREQHRPTAKLSE